MRRADEFLSMMARVQVPTESSTLNGIVTADGFVCARGAAGDFDFLIPESSEAEHTTDSRVGSVRVTSGCEYRIDIGSATRTGTFLRLSLASDRADLLQAFVFTIAAMLPDELPLADASSLSSRLIEILRLLQSDPQPTAETIKGLWAELWLIRASPDQATAIRGWHGRSTDKIDFDVAGLLLEVKCHEGRARIHSLRLDQLLLRPDATYVVSICVAASPGGDSISSLISEIVPNLGSAETQRLMSQVLTVVGADFDLLSDYRFSIWADSPPVAVPSAFVPRPIVEDRSISLVSFRVDLTAAAERHGQPLDRLLALSPGANEQAS